MNSFIGWIGGKKLLRKDILNEFPADNEYTRYIEVFGGAGWILFSKESHSKFEVFNDVNRELINLYKTIKYHPDALQKELEWALTSRELFFSERDKDIFTMTEIQRAARMFFIIKESFGSDMRSFGVRPKSMIRAADFLKEVSKRLDKVVIENLDFERIVRTYDRKDALFYLDPPYYDAEKYYPDRFNPEDHIRLNKILKEIKGKFILSYNDCAQIRELYKDYELIEVSRINSLVLKNGVSQYKELIIKNY